MTDFDKYVELIRQFRLEVSKKEAPTQQEIEDWRAEWSKWTRRRRAQELGDVQTHLIIARMASQPRNN